MVIRAIARTTHFDIVAPSVKLLHKRTISSEVINVAFLACDRFIRLRYLLDMSFSVSVDALYDRPVRAKLCVGKLHDVIILIVHIESQQNRIVNIIARVPLACGRPWVRAPFELDQKL